MEVIYSELDTYADVVEGYVHFPTLQVDFTAIFRDGFAEDVEFDALRCDHETGEPTGGVIGLAERVEILEALETLAEDYWHGRDEQDYVRRSA